jgi:hypothetical protein
MISAWWLLLIVPAAALLAVIATYVGFIIYFSRKLHDH